MSVPFMSIHNEFDKFFKSEAIAVKAINEASEKSVLN
jgi:hypothetical protein